METEPLTAREALLEIRRICRDPMFQGLGFVFDIDGVAKAGLDRNSALNFELSDQLADRLARAHRILADLRQGDVELADIASDIDEALMVPPDIEAMLERRVRG